MVASRTIRNELSKLTEKGQGKGMQTYGCVLCVLGTPQPNIIPPKFKGLARRGAQTGRGPGMTKWRDTRGGVGAGGRGGTMYGSQATQNSKVNWTW